MAMYNIIQYAQTRIGMLLTTPEQRYMAQVLHACGFTPTTVDHAALPLKKGSHIELQTSAAPPLLFGIAATLLGTDCPVPPPLPSVGATWVLPGEIADVFSGSLLPAGIVPPRLLIVSFGLTVPLRSMCGPAEPSGCAAALVKPGSLPARARGWSLPPKCFFYWGGYISGSSS